MCSLLSLIVFSCLRMSLQAWQSFLSNWWLCSCKTNGTFSLELIVATPNTCIFILKTVTCICALSFLENKQQEIIWEWFKIQHNKSVVLINADIFCDSQTVHTLAAYSYYCKSRSMWCGKSWDKATVHSAHIPFCTDNNDRWKKVEKGIHLYNILLWLRWQRTCRLLIMTSWETLSSTFS